MGEIRVAIVGVGNCASSLVQGVEFYRDAAADETIPGLMHPVLGDYGIDDISFVAAFDVDATKVGQDLSKAILAGENNTTAFAEVPQLDVTVQRGPTLDGIGAYLTGVVEESAAPEVDVAEELRRARADVVVSYLPVGSQEATEFYARQALEAGCAFVNCIPVFIARTEEWAERFRRARLPIVGDDIKSQVGATILHRTLVNLFQDRGVKVDRTYQLNFGGNTDFLNMLERSRLVSKKESKTKAVTSQMETRLPVDDIHVGPSDHVPWLTDRKWAHIRLEGTAFGNTPLNAEVKLEVWDSPNSAGVVIDALRCAKIGLDRGMAGPLYEASAYFMKSPPRQMRDEVAREALEAFIDG
ncbi:MAG: inositol-3-phosphate synthase [Acidimicrobiia bacterium]|nr:inositol-3-phosphate synthase [Acidimicrobiia bacterium]